MSRLRTGTAVGARSTARSLALSPALSAAIFAVLLLLPIAAAGLAGGFASGFAAGLAAKPALAADGSFEVLVDHDGDPNTPPVREFAGASRYETSLAAARHYLNTAAAAGTPATTAIVASGESLIDAAAAAGLARAVNAPVLLTPSSQLFIPAAHLIEGAGITRVIVTGGPVAVSEQVAATLRGINGVASVERFGGANRFDTAALLAAASTGAAGTGAPSPPSPGAPSPAPLSPAFTNQAAADPSAGRYCDESGRAVVLVAGDAESFADITIAGPLSYAMGLPILLTSTQGVPAETMRALGDLGLGHVVVVGGSYSIGDPSALEAQLRAAGVAKVTSLSAPNQFATSIEVLEALERCLGTAFDATSVALVSDTALPDGISAAPMLGRGLNGGGKTTPVLLVTADGLPTEAKKYLQSQDTPVALTTIGGVNAVADEVVTSAVAAANEGAEPATDDDDDDDDDDRGGGGRGGSGGGSGGGTPPPRGTTTTTTTTTVAPLAAATFTNLASADTSAFDFGAGVRTINFTVSPATVPVTITPTSSSLFSTWSLTDNGSGSYTITIQPPAIDPGTGGPYSETLTVTAAEDGRETATQVLTFTINPTPITLTGLPAAADLALTYADTASTFTLTAFPTDAEVSVSTSGGAVTAAVAPISSTPGEHTLTITPPSTGTNLDNTVVTITATDPDGGRTELTQDITFTVAPRAAATFTNLASADTSAFDFGAGVRTINFTVSPATVPVAITPTSSNLFSTWSLTNNGSGSYTLTIQPLADDPGTTPPFFVGAIRLYSETLTVTAGEDGRTSATQDLTFTINPSPIELADLPPTATTPFTFSGEDREQTFDFTVTPANAAVTVTAAAANVAATGVTAAVAARGTNAGDYTLTVTAPDTDDGSGPYSDTIIVNASSTGRTAATPHQMALTLTPAPIALSGVPTGAQTTLEYTSGETTHTITVTPPTINLAVSSTGSVVGATITVDDRAAGTWTLTVTPRTTGTFTPNGTVTIIATDPATLRTKVEEPITYTVTPRAAATFTGLDAANTAAFDFGDDARTINFSVSPATVPVAITPTSSNLFSTWSLTNNGNGSYTLSIRPLAADPTIGRYSETVTVTATEDGRTTTTQQLTFTINSSAVELTGLPTEVQKALTYAADASTFTLTADPTDATVTATSTGGAVTVAVEPVIGTAGDHTLTVTPPSTGTNLDDTVVKITVTDPDGGRPMLIETITFTVAPRAAATFSTLSNPAVIDAFEFEVQDIRGIPFQVTPNTVPVTISPTTSSLFMTWDIIGATSSPSGWKLKIQPPFTDPGTGGPYSETLTVTAAEDGRETATQVLTFTINPSPIALTGLPAAADLALTYADTASTFTLTAFPTDAEVSVSTSGGTVAATVSPVTGTPGQHTLTVTPPSTGTNLADTVVTITATDPDGGRTELTQDITFTVAPRAAATFTGLDAAGITDALAFGAGVRTINFTVSPDTVPVTITPTSSTLFSTWSLTDKGSGSYTLTIQPLATDPGTGGPYSETLTVTATENGRTTTTQDLTFTINPTPITLTGLPASVATPFNFGGATRMLPFTIAPPNATFTFTFDVNPNNLFDAEVTGTGANRVLEITPVATDPDTGTYAERIVFTTSAAGRENVNSVVTATVNEPTGIENVAANTAAFAFGDSARTITFDIVPADATFTVTSANTVASANNAFTVTKALDTGTARRFTIAPPASDDGAGPYTDTITITATSAAGSVTHEFTLTLTPTPISLTGVPTGAQTILAYGASDETFTVTVTPPTVTLAASSANSVVGVMIEPATGGAAGEHTLTITPPSTGATYTDTVAITATDPAGLRTEVTENIVFTITPRSAATFTGLDAASNRDAFDFGDTTRTINFTVSPATVPVTISPTSSTLFSTWTLANNGSGSYTLTIQPLADDPGTGSSYSQALIVTASEDGRTSTTHPLTFTINPSPIELTSLPATAVFDFGDAARPINFTVFPTDATFTATSNVVTAAVTGTGNTRTLTITPPATDGGTYTDMVTVTASATGRADATHTITVTINSPSTPVSPTTTTTTIPDPPAILLLAVVSGLPTGAERVFDFNDNARTFDLTTDPVEATLTTSAKSDNDLFDVTLSPVPMSTAGEWTLSVTPPATDSAAGGPYTDTVTIDITSTGYIGSSPTITFTINPPPVVLTGLPTGDQPALQFGQTAEIYDFTVDPTTANVTAVSDNALLQVGLLPARPSGWRLHVTPPTTDSAAGGPYTDTVTVTATATNRTTVTHTITYTILEPVVLSCVPADDPNCPLNVDPDIVDFADPVITIPLTVEPATATVNAISIDSLFTAALTDNGSGSWTLSVTPPAADSAAGGPYADTITVTATAAGRSTTRHRINFGVTRPPPPITQGLTFIYGVLPGTQPAFDFGDDARTFNLAVDPPEAVITYLSGNNLLDVSLIPVTGSTTGEWTLSVTPPAADSAAGGPYTDTITLTATATMFTTNSRTLVFPINQPPVVVLARTPTAAETTFNFGDDALSSTLTVDPTTATVTAPSSTTNGIFSVSVTPATGGAAGEWILSVTPPAADTEAGGPYTDSITLTASATGYVSVTQTITFTINPPTVLTGLPTGTDLVFDFGDDARTFNLTVDPANAKTTVSSSLTTPESIFDVMLTGTDANRVLSVRPPAADDGGGIYSEMLFITVTAANRSTSTHTVTFTINRPSPLPPLPPPPLSSQPVMDGLPTSPPPLFSTGRSPPKTFTFTVEPPDANVEAVFNNALFNTWILDNGNGSKTFGIEPVNPLGGYSDTVTITATANGLSSTPHAIRFGVSGPASMTGLPTGQQSYLEFGEEAREIHFTVSPAHATITTTADYDLFTVSVSGSSADRVLSVQPPDSNSRYSDDITITASANGYTEASQEIRFRIALSPPSTPRTLDHQSANPATCRLRGLNYSSGRIGRDTVTSAFPLPEWAPYTRGSVKVAVLYAEYNDHEADYEVSDESAQITLMEEYIAANSYGQIDVEFVANTDWLTLSENYLDYIDDPEKIALEVVELAEDDFDFSDGFDSVMIVFPSKIHSGGGAAKGVSDLTAENPSLTRTAVVNTSFQIANSPQPWWDIGVHELFHNFGLPDLYPTDISFYQPGDNPREGKAWVTLKMGIMELRAHVRLGIADPRFQVDITTTGSPAANDLAHTFDDLGIDDYAGLELNEMLAWSRWQLDWLTQDKVECLTDDIFDETITLSPIATTTGTAPTGKAMIVVPINNYTGVVIESRRRLGYDNTLVTNQRSCGTDCTIDYEAATLLMEGLLIYLVDGSIDSGNVPITHWFEKPLRPDLLEDYPILAVGATTNKVLSDGSTLDISLLSETATGEYSVQVIRTAKSTS